MKKIIFIFAFTLLTLTSFGQNVTKNYIRHTLAPTPEMLNVNNFTNQFNTVIDNGLPLVLNVKFHGLHETNGSDLHNINEARFLKIIASLNVNFNQFNIFFKYRGYSIINESSLFNDLNSWFDTTTLQGNYDVAAINIFINPGTEYGWCSIGGNIVLTTDMSDANDINGISPFYDYQPNVFMGATLGLMGIYNGSESKTQITNNLPSCISFPFMNKAIFGTITGVENVARSGANFNAETAGDMVVDTQACFEGFTQNYCNNSAPFQNFAQHPDVVDPTLTMYNCTAVESHNFMQGDYAGIPNSFTPGQGARMRQFIISDPSNNFNPKLNLLDNGVSDISVLYEPFAIDGSNGGNTSNNTTAYSKIYTTNTTSTGANIWNCGPFTMRFQTGFDCEFYPYNASAIAQTPYQHLDYPTTTSISVKIPILGQQIYQNVAPVCFYSYEPFTSGDVKSLDNLGSSYYTQEELDKIKASDPKLFEQLQSGKYHIITKQTDSGFIDQKIIFKN